MQKCFSLLKMKNEKLGFEFTKTNNFVSLVWKDGKWSDKKVSTDFHLNVHLAATVFHYGQSCFEGLKAFTCKDGKVRLFRPEKNAVRMQHSAAVSSMVAPPTPLFIDAVVECVKQNLEFVPAYGVGSLYIRPFLFGSGPQLGVSPSKEYTFVVYCSPVGNYYADGIKPVKALIQDEFDRAAPLGVGSAVFLDLI